MIHDSKTERIGKRSLNGCSCLVFSMNTTQKARTMVDKIVRSVEQCWEEVEQGRKYIEQEQK